MSDIQFSMSMPEELKANLEVFSKTAHLSSSYIANQAIAEYLQRHRLQTKKTEVVIEDDPLLAMVGLGKNHRCFESTEEIDNFVREQRDEWN